MRFGRGAFFLGALLFGASPAGAFIGFFKGMIGSAMWLEQRAYMKVMQTNSYRQVARLTNNYTEAKKAVNEIKGLNRDINDLRDYFSPDATLKRYQQGFERSVAEQEGSLAKISRAMDKRGAALAEGAAAGIDRKVIDPIGPGPSIPGLDRLEAAGENVAAKIWRENGIAATASYLEQKDPDFRRYKTRREFLLAKLDWLHGNREKLIAAAQKSGRLSPADATLLTDLNRQIDAVEMEMRELAEEESAAVRRRIAAETSLTAGVEEELAAAPQKFSYDILDYAFTPVKTANFAKWTQITRSLAIVLLAGAIAGLVLYTGLLRQGLENLVEAAAFVLVAVIGLLAYEKIWTATVSIMTAVESAISVKNIEVEFPSPYDAFARRKLGPKYLAWRDARDAIASKYDAEIKSLREKLDTAPLEIRREIDKEIRRKKEEKQAKIDELKEQERFKELKDAETPGFINGALNWGTYLMERINLFFLGFLHQVGQVFMLLPALLRLMVLDVLYVIGPIAIVAWVFPLARSISTFWLRMLGSTVIWGLAMRVLAVFFGEILGEAGALVGAGLYAKIITTGAILPVLFGLISAVFLPALSIFATAAGSSGAALMKMAFRRG